MHRAGFNATDDGLEVEPRAPAPGAGDVVGLMDINLEFKRNYCPRGLATDQTNKASDGEVPALINLHYSVDRVGQNAGKFVR
jgi:hypothetical protein